MLKFYRILWSIAILLIIITTVIFSIGVTLVGVAVAGLVGIYQYYITKRRSRKCKIVSNRYTYGEVIDVPAEVIPQTIQVRNPDKISLIKQE